MTAHSVPPPLLVAARADNRLSTIDHAREYAEASRSESTRRGYRAAQYVKLGTLKRRLSSISLMHRERGLETPTAHVTVRRVIKGVARTKGSAQIRKSAIMLDVLRAMLLEIRAASLKAKRDRAKSFEGVRGSVAR